MALKLQCNPENSTTFFMYFTYIKKNDILHIFPTLHEKKWTLVLPCFASP